MSEAQKAFIIEQAEELAAFEADYNDMVKQRDKAERDVDYLEGLRRQQDAAKKEAAIQEKVDGIRAGLIPVEDLRKAIIDSERVDTVARVELGFLGTDDRIQQAIRDALIPAKPQSKPGGYAPARSKIATSNPFGTFVAAVNKYYPGYGYGA
jgi:hypothetical protein